MPNKDQLTRGWINHLLSGPLYSLTNSNLSIMAKLEGKDLLFHLLGVDEAETSLRSDSMVVVNLLFYCS